MSKAEWQNQNDKSKKNKCKMTITKWQVNNEKIEMTKAKNTKVEWRKQKVNWKKENDKSKWQKQNANRESFSMRGLVATCNEKMLLRRTTKPTAV